MDVHTSDRQTRFSRMDEIDNTPFFDQPLPKNLTAIVITYCFRPLGVIMGFMTTSSKGWGQKCICCMEEIGPYDYFSEIHGKRFPTDAYDPPVNARDWNMYLRLGWCSFTHYVCDSCNFLKGSNWFIPIEYKGDDRYGSRINDRRRRRSLNPRRRISHRNAMMCPVTKLIKCLGGECDPLLVIKHNERSPDDPHGDCDGFCDHDGTCSDNDCDGTCDHDGSCVW